MMFALHCMVAVPRPMLCMLMSSFEIHGRDIRVGQGGGGGRGVLKIDSTLCLCYVSAQPDAQIEP